MIFLLLSAILIILFAIYGNRWQLHLVINIALHLFYLSLWISAIFHISYIGYILMYVMLYMAPVSILLYIIAIIYGKVIKESRIVKINIIGLFICITYALIILISMY